MFTVKGISHRGEVTLLEARKVRVERDEEGDYVRLFDDRSDGWFYSFQATTDFTDDPAKVATVIIENDQGKTSQIVRADRA